MGKHWIDNPEPTKDNVKLAEAIRRNAGYYSPRYVKWASEVLKNELDPKYGH